MWGTFVVLAAVAVVRASEGVGVTYPELRREVSSRILSGWQATEGQFPFAVALRCIAGPQLSTAGRVSGCGASMLHPQWALTAAHCIARSSHIVISVGTLNISRPHLIFESSEYYSHPLFNEATPGVVQHNDIGLLKMTVPIEFNHLIQPVRLQRSADRFQNYFDQQLVAAGWGLLWTDGSFPDALRWVYLRGETNQRCLEDMATIGAAHVVTTTTVCARGWNDTTQSTCHGDSGGPLVRLEADGSPTLIGITSFVAAIGCHIDLPAGFTRTGYYHDFLRQTTGINFDW